jgi:hypothetical protein
MERLAYAATLVMPPGGTPDNPIPEGDVFTPRAVTQPAPIIEHEEMAKPEKARKPSKKAAKPARAPTKPHPKPRTASAEALCASCGTSFAPATLQARFCSNKCRQKAHRDKRK